MARTSVEVMQTPWDCKHGQPGHQLSGVSDEEQPEGAWVCTRPTSASDRRTVTDEECATCANWVADDDPMPTACAPLEFTMPDVSELTTRRRMRRAILVASGVALLGIGVGLAGTLVMLPVGGAFMVIGAATLAAGARDETEQMTRASVTRA